MIALPRLSPSCLNLMFGGAINFGDSQMKYAILENYGFVSYLTNKRSLPDKDEPLTIRNVPSVPGIKIYFGTFFRRKIG